MHIVQNTNDPNRVVELYPSSSIPVRLGKDKAMVHGLKSRFLERSLLPLHTVKNLNTSYDEKADGMFCGVSQHACSYRVSHETVFQDKVH